MTCDTWHETRDTCDTWHMRHETWHILSKCQLPSSYCLVFMIFWRFVRKGWLTEWMNGWMNNKAVCRAAPATPGLVNMTQHYNTKIQCPNFTIRQYITHSTKLYKLLWNILHIRYKHNKWLKAPSSTTRAWGRRKDVSTNQEWPNLSINKLHHIV